jgi:DNA-binding transcriptional ArsR family regulator
MADKDLAARVTALEAAIARLPELIRELVGVSPGVARRKLPDQLEGGGAFWILDGLKQRVPGGAVAFAGDVPLPSGERYEWQWARTVDDLLDSDWSEAVAGLAALAHPVRLRLLHLVLSGARTAAELAGDAELGTTGQLYHHLRQLVAAGWLRSSGRGRYAVPGERVVHLLVILMGAQR